MTMEIKCTDNKTFALTDGSQELGHMSYDCLFTHRAVATIGDEHFEIDTVGIFSSTISVTQQGKEVASLQMGWKGEIIISLERGGEFVLKPSGFFKSSYILADADQQQVLVLVPDFNWKKFHYNYIVSYDNKPEDILLVLLAAYSVNYYVAAMSGVY